MDLDEIVDTFEALEPGEERYRFLIDLGKDLEGLPDALKTEENRVLGCQSRVWLDVRPAADAHLLDTSEMSIEAAFQAARAIVDDVVAKRNKA